MLCGGPLASVSFLLKTTSIHCFVLFPVAPRSPPGVPWVPRGPFSEGSRKFEEVGEDSRKFEEVGEGSRKFEEVGEGSKKFEEVGGTSVKTSMKEYEQI